MSCESCRAARDPVVRMGPAHFDETGVLPCANDAGWAVASPEEVAAIRDVLAAATFLGGLAPAARRALEALARAEQAPADLRRQLYELRVGAWRRCLRAGCCEPTHEPACLEAMTPSEVAHG